MLEQTDVVVSALKFIYRAAISRYPTFTIDVESIAKALFVSPGVFVKQTIAETLEIASFTGDNKKDEEVENDAESENNPIINNKTFFSDSIRFIALIERILDIISSHDITLEHSFTVALYCLLDDQRSKELSSGRYMEAGEAQKLLDDLFNFEVTERHREFFMNQKRKLANLEKAHQEQFENFTKDWEVFNTKFDKSADSAIAAMKERHCTSIHKYEQKLEMEARRKPRLFSKELKEWRKKEKLLVQEQDYSGAQRVKLIADAVEGEEKERLDAYDDNTVQRKLSNLRQQQENEMNALLKRIESQRESFRLKKDNDAKCLLQRNQNIQSTWRSKFSTEDQKHFGMIEIKVQDDIALFKQAQICPK